MAKELPYFQFEPAEYLTKDISFCSLEAQGLFINVCSYYWQRQCELTKSQFLRRLNYPKQFDELVSEGVIDLDGENIIIKFLDAQLQKATKISEEQSRKGKLGGRPPKKNPNESQTKAEINPNESQTKAIREDKIIEKEIKEEQKNIPPTKVVDLDFDKLLILINEKTKRKFLLINKAVQNSFKARLKDGYTKENILTAINNAVKNTAHKENNYQYLTPEFFSRASTLDKYGTNVAEKISQGQTFSPSNLNLR